MSQEQDRQKHLDLIIESHHRYKIIVAGAGTGKTYTFKQLLLKNLGVNVVLTFINNLANDIVRDIGSLAEARTFHSYCRKLLHKLPLQGIDSRFHFFPKLGKVIESDAKVLYVNSEPPAEADFQEAFQSLIEDDGRIEFFLQRADYYNAVGFDDSVYRVLCSLRNDPNSIPVLNQLILDEYQDFNALEVGFITLMEGKSPTLIVGDDDQAIYNFKHASPDYLRRKAKSSFFKRFDLPFCSRCTEVIVKATNSVIQKACSVGLLTGRLDKDYVCYIPDKKSDNLKYPKIVHAECSTHNSRSPYISMYIERTIRQIPPEEAKQSIAEGYPLALVVGPSHYLKQIYEYFQSVKDDFPNVIYLTSPDMSLVPLDGYMCLLQDDMSNLGWRIILEVEIPELLPDLLKRSSNANIINLIDNNFRQKHQQHLQRLLVLKQNKDGLSLSEKNELENYFKMTCDEILSYISRITQQDSDDIETDLGCHDSSPDDRPVVRLTTYNGCKGLSAGFTFVTGLEEGVFPRNNSSPTDTEVCQFIVAMTRTRKECHLISTRNFAGNWTKSSVFLGWIPNDSMTAITANKNYFAK
jgi:superfamily I DNA/RNA helicase